ncbi:MAG: hypothetical protein AAGC44_04190 [Planctomycetota bacterium]
MKLALVPFIAIACTLVGCHMPAGSVSDDLSYEGALTQRQGLNDEARRRLAAPVRFEAGPYTLADVARLVQRQTGVAVRFQWDALAGLGIDPAEPIAFASGTSPADRLLDTLLLELFPPTSPATWVDYPTYLLVDGQVVIGTNRSLQPLTRAVDWPRPDGRRIDLDEAARRALQANVVSVDEDQVSLRFAIEQLQQTTGVPIQMDWPGLEVVGIDQDSLVLIGVTMRGDVYLDYILRMVSHEQFDGDKAGYTIRDGAVHVTTLNEMRDETQARVYKVHDLVDRPFGPLLETVYADDELAIRLLRKYQFAWLVDLGGTRIIDFDLDDALQGSTGQDLQALRTIERSWSEAVHARQEALEQIAQLIQDTTGVIDDWLDGAATVRELDGALIITADRKTHEEIEVLLEDLHEQQVARVHDFMRDLDVARLLGESETLRAEGDYRAALVLTEAAITVDPHSVPARALHQAIVDVIARSRASEADY